MFVFLKLGGQGQIMIFPQQRDSEKWALRLQQGNRISIEPPELASSSQGTATVSKIRKLSNY
jgi:hypothetical protein